MKNPLPNMTKKTNIIVDTSSWINVFRMDLTNYLIENFYVRVTPKVNEEILEGKGFAEDANLFEKLSNEKMLEIKLKEEYDGWLRKIAKEVSISPEELAYMSIEKFINEYRTRKAVKAYVEGKISLGKAAEVAGTSKRKIMAMIEDLGIPLNIGAHDLVKGLEFLSGLRRYSIGEKKG